MLDTDIIITPFTPVATYPRATDITTTGTYNLTQASGQGGLGQVIVVPTGTAPGQHWSITLIPVTGNIWISTQQDATKSGSVQVPAAGLTIATRKALYMWTDTAGGASVGILAGCYYETLEAGPEHATVLDITPPPE